MYDIDSFGELINMFCYSYEYPQYQITTYHIVDGSRTYSINKLYIEQDKVSYKTEHYSLDPKVFEKFEAFVCILNMITGDDE